MSYPPYSQIRIALLTGFLALFLLPSFAMAQNVARPEPKTWTIVIDAGHGGKEPGAINGSVKEKDITLAIALKLGKMLSNLENTKIIYTRDSDVAVELHARADKANQNKADLFISIHCNSTESSKPYGTETWIMGLHKSKANLEVAKKENAVILLEDNYKAKYDGFDPNSPEAEIIFSLYQNAYLDQSMNLAAMIQKEFRVNAQRFDRGVKQAGFLVLYKTSMPGILIETGFISNENECKYLTSDAGKSTIATSIYNAVLNYRESVDGYRPKPKKQEPVTKSVEPVNTSGNATSPSPTASQIKENVLVEKEHKEPEKEIKDTAVAGLDKSSEAKKPDKDTQPAIQNPEDKTQSNQIHVDQNPQPKTLPAPAKSQDVKPEVWFSVQFLTSKNKFKTNDPAFKGIDDVYFYEFDGSYRYCSGHFQTQAEANKHKTSFQNGVYKDAFVVALRNGKRISLDEAAKLLAR
jgi:N-acetylmuramoyl-L-alanine amidase